MKIVIVGGGTAGWITALYAKKVYPNHKVLLIESEEIGILGAGEGTTPHLVELFDFLNIPFSNLVKNCDATVKNGIKFSNWSEKNNGYIHPFYSNSLASNDYNFYINNHLENDTGFSHIYSSKFDHNLENYSLIQKISNNFSVPFIKNNEKNVKNEILKFNHLSSWSFHFNARTLAQYLRKIGEDRGIIRIEGIVKKIILDNNGFIKEILLNDEKIKTHFVFDCTGFKRLIIGNFYKTKWKSYAESLPAKKAIPFFLNIDEKIPPYTESIAMNYGWMWKIPLQNRYGCGYVFDSNFISDEQAQKEIQSFIGKEIDFSKIFSFDAGHYEKVWVKNCLAVGLSSGFIEPLEATSLWQIQSTLTNFFRLYKNIDNTNEENTKIVNKYYNDQTDEIVNFLYLHYLTNKKNTDFWKNFKNNNKTPDFIKHVLHVIKERQIDELDFIGNNKTFNLSSYFYVLVGNEIIKKDDLKKYLKLMKVDHTNEYLSILKNQKEIVDFAVNHSYFLNELKKF
jgi:tryptophan halogenase